MSVRVAALVDDLSGAEATTRIVFSVGRTAYRLDLDDANIEAFEQAVDPYLRTAPVLGQIRIAPGLKPDRRRPSDVASLAEWARRNGIFMSDAADPPRDVVVAYNAWRKAVAVGLMERRHST